MAALVSNLAIDLFHKSGRVDDTLDVFASHGIGGMVGMVLTGVFAAEVGLTSGEFDTLASTWLRSVAVGAFGLSMRCSPWSMRSFPCA